MKNLKSPPTDMEFAARHARIRSISWIIVATLIVSGTTEIGGIFTAAVSAFGPIAGQYSWYVAGAIALIATLVLEGGLRIMIPQAVDSFLYKRFQGLDLALTVIYVVLGIGLMATSGYLSFQNSKIIVDSVVVEPERDSLAIKGARIDYNASQAKAAETYRNDSTATTQRYQERLAAEETAYAGKIGAAKRELSNIYRKRNFRKPKANVLPRWMAMAVGWRTSPLFHCLSSFFR